VGVTVIVFTRFSLSLQQYQTIRSMQAWALGSEASGQRAHQQQQNLGTAHKPSSGDQLVQVSCCTLSFVLRGKSHCIPSPRKVCKCTFLPLRLSSKLYMGLHNPIGTTKLAALLFVHLISSTPVMKSPWASSCRSEKLISGMMQSEQLIYCTTQ
jgi:hypothetical protein